jgi:hypothetical protein
MPAKVWSSKGRIVSAAAVTPSDTVSNEYDALFVGGAGNVAVILRDDTAAVTFLSIGNGEYMPMSVKKVMSTNTSATNIIGLIVEPE